MPSKFLRLAATFPLPVMKLNTGAAIVSTPSKAPFINRPSTSTARSLAALSESSAPPELAHLCTVGPFTKRPPWLSLTNNVSSADAETVVAVTEPSFPNWAALD